MVQSVFYFLAIILLSGGFMKEFLKKFSYFILCLLIGILTIIAAFNILIKQGDVVYFKVYPIAILGTIIASIGWIIKYKDLFENFIVSFAYLCFFCFFLFIGPATLERSLSVFIYFYSVQNGSIKQNYYDETFFQNFVTRRYDDGQKIGFLKCNSDGLCKPTLKTKILYRIFYPYGKLTKCLYYYDEFKKSIDSLK